MTSNVQEVVGPFPEWLAAKPVTTSIEDLDPEQFIDLRNEASMWHATELLEGDHMTVFMDATNTMRVCSKNLEIAEGDNILWDAARSAEFEDHLRPFVTIHSMVVDGIAYVYDYIDGALPVPRGLWPSFNTFQIPLYNLELPMQKEDAIEQVQGLRSLRLAAPTKGVVWWGEGLFMNTRCFTVLNEEGINDEGRNADSR